MPLGTKLVSFAGVSSEEDPAPPIEVAGADDPSPTTMVQETDQRIHRYALCNTQKWMYMHQYGNNHIAHKVLLLTTAARADKWECMDEESPQGVG